jgi:hypothetical protein
MKNKLLLIAMGLALTTQMISAQIPSYVPTNGLVAYYPFTDNANDESGNVNNGIVNGATLTTDRFGNINSAYNFNGSSWIEVPYNQIFNFGTNSFTLSCWASKEGSTQWQHLITRNYIPIWPNSTGNYALRYDNDNIGFYSSAGTIGSASSSNGILISSQQNNLTNWNHFVGVFNSVTQNMQIYMNGNLIASGPLNIPIQNYDSIGNMYFGVEHPTTVLPSGPQFLTGKIDDIGIWNRALTQEEITSLYYSENTCQSLVINTGVLSFNPPTYNNTITIYPNPANDHITIDCGNLANVSGWTIKIVNTLGQEVFSGAMNTQQYVVPLNSWSGQGVYFVKIYDASNNLLNTKKIILQ